MDVVARIRGRAGGFALTEDMKIGAAIAGLILVTLLATWYVLEKRDEDRPEKTLVETTAQSLKYAQLDLEYASSLPVLPRLDRAWSAVVTHVEGCGLTWEAENANALASDKQIYLGPATAWHMRVDGSAMDIITCSWMLGQQFPVYFNEISIDGAASRIRLSVLGSQ